MPHIRARKYSAIEEKMKIYEEYMRKVDELTEVQNQLQDEMKQLKVKYDNDIKNQDIIIDEEDKKEVQNSGPTLTRNIGMTATERKAKEEKVQGYRQISYGYRCAICEQPKKPDGYGGECPNEEYCWSPVLGLWVDWRGDLAPKYRTSMCRRFADGGRCREGDKCCFAHHESKLRPSYSIKQLFPIEDYEKHKTRVHAKLKEGWDWRKELIEDKLVVG